MPNFTLKFTNKLKRGRDRARSSSSSCGASQGLAGRDTHTDTASSADASTSTSTSAGTSTSSANARPSLPRTDPDHPKRAGRLKRTFKAIFPSRKKEAKKTPTTTTSITPITPITPITTGATTTTTAAPDASHQSQGHAHDHDQHHITTALVHTPTPSSSSSDCSVASRRGSLHSELMLCTDEQALHETLHHCSVLDASRHRRYGLFPEDIFEPRPVPVLPTILDCLPPPIEIISISVQPLTQVAVAADESQACPLLAPTSLAKRHNTLSVASSKSDVHKSTRAAARQGSSTAHAQVEIITSEVNSIPFPHMQSRRGSGASTALDVAANATASSSIVPSVCSTRVPTAQDMCVLRFLAEGTSGKVYHVEDRVTRARIALKVISKADKTDFLLDVLLAERDISEKLADCQWFVKLYCSWHDHDFLYIAMTVYPTDLDSELIKHDKLHPHRARFYMAELIIALSELHSRGIIHRDVKAPNILIDRAGHIVLADFGLSKDFGKRPTMQERVYQPFWPYLADERPTPNTPRRSPEELNFVTWDYRGSELEMAPEIHLRQPYSFGVDFWSAAVVLYWMLTGRPPWYEEEDDKEEHNDDATSSSSHYKQKPLSLKVIEDDLYWDEEDDVDEVTKDFVEQMLRKKPASRLMISYQMPRHPYFAGINWPAMEARHVPAPWLPEHDVCHAYAPSSPTFVPGMPYGSGECDPYPEFTYVSEDATPRAEVQPSGSIKDSDDSDCYEAAEVVTVVVRRRTAYGGDDIVERGEQTLVAMDAADDASVDLSLEQEVEQEEAAGEEELQRGWDHTMVNPAPTSPLGQGPKQLLQAQELHKIHSAPISTHSSRSPSRRRLSPPLPSPLSPCYSPSPFVPASLSPSPSPSSPPSFMASDSESVEVMYIRRTSSLDAPADSGAPHHGHSRYSSQTALPSSSHSASPSPSPLPSPSSSRRLRAIAKFKVLVSKLGKRSGKKQQ